MSLLFQLIGSAFILAAFAANQVWRTSDSSRSYLTANALGSLALAVSALLGSQWGFLALEGTWCLVSLFGLYRAIAGARLHRRESNASSAVSAGGGIRETTTKGRLWIL